MWIHILKFMHMYKSKHIYIDGQMHICVFFQYLKFQYIQQETLKQYAVSSVSFCIKLFICELFSVDFWKQLVFDLERWSDLSLEQRLEASSDWCTHLSEVVGGFKMTLVFLFKLQSLKMSACGWLTQPQDWIWCIKGIFQMIKSGVVWGTYWQSDFAAEELCFS